MKVKTEGKVYLFDFDGTVADSMPIAVDLVLSFLREQGISYPDDIVKTLTPLGFHGIARYYTERFGVELPPQEILAWFMRKLATAYAEEIPLKPTAKETLTALKDRGARLCILTGSPHLFVDPCLKRTGVFDLFEYVWSTDDFGMVKSDPAIYRAVAEKMNVRAQDLLVVDDGLQVLKTAREAGAYAIGAYDRYSATEEELQMTSDEWVYTLAELL